MYLKIRVGLVMRFSLRQNNYAVIPNNLQNNFLIEYNPENVLNDILDPIK